jgi:hypothetical protein
MNLDTQNFLNALLWTLYNDDDTKLNADNFTVYDFHPEQVLAIEKWIEGFKQFLSERGVDISVCNLSFGGNCYLSLSRHHSVGFWLDTRTSHLQHYLFEYANNKYLFEHIYLTHKGEYLFIENLNI